MISRPKNASGYEAMFKDEAEILYEVFKNLEGMKYYDNGTLYDIECICIAPFDKVNQKLFIYRYQKYNNAKNALAFYEEPYLDVIAILKITDTERIEIMGVRQLTTEKVIL